MQRLRRLAGRGSARQEERCFVVEGPKVLAEALASGAAVDTVYLEPDQARPADLAVAERCAAAGARVLEVQPGVLARACDTMTPQPVAAVVPMLDVDLATALDGPRRGPVVVCAGIADPGNAGALLRSAAAAGAAALVVCSGSVDVYAPKTVRASAGTLFHLPVVAGGVPIDVLAEIGRRGRQRWGTAARGGDDYATADLTRPAALVLGSEAHGLPAELHSHLDGLLTIPMDGPADSLNVAVAASVLLFEAARQRRHRPSAGARGAA